MVIPRHDNSHSTALSLICISLVLRVVAGTSGPMPTRSGASTGNCAAIMTPEEAKRAIDPLVHALNTCRDDGAAWHLRYRVGVIHFKAGTMAEAEACFQQIADASEAPELIQACALNMAGQVARLQGDNDKALKALGRLAGLAERSVAARSGDASNAMLCRLWCAALIGRAEICELQKDYIAAANEYKRLLQARIDLENNDAFAGRIPLVMDRLSQLHLQERHVDEYLSLATALTARFPAYPRAPLIELESLCVRALRDARPAPEYAQGALCAPAHLIEHLRQAHHGLQAREQRGRDGRDTVLDAIDQICQRHQGTPMGALLDYHYAWLLEAAGRRDKAMEAIARVSGGGRRLPRASRGDDRDRPDEPVVPEAGRPHEDILREYAIIQHAIMLAERGDYSKASQLLATLSPDPDGNPHVSLLTESVSKSIQTLKREVPKDATRQHE